MLVGVIVVAMADDVGQGLIDGQREMTTGGFVETDACSKFFQHCANWSEKFGPTQDTGFEMGSGEIGFHKVKRSWDRLRRKKREEWMCKSQGGRWQNDGGRARRGANPLNRLGRKRD